MSQQPQNSSTPITTRGFANIAVFIVLLVVLGGTVAYFKNFPMTQAPAKQPTDSTQEAETQKQNVKTQLPIENTVSEIEELVWSEPVKTEYRDYFEMKGENPVSKILKGYEMNSHYTENVNDNPLTESLRAWSQYKFTQMGWKEINSISADGATGSRWGYEKENTRIIFNYHFEYSTYIPHVGEIDEGLCPCDYIISIFSDDKNILNMIKNTPLPRSPKN